MRTLERFGASYLPLAQRLMIEAATAADRVLKGPAPTVWLRGFGDRSVDHGILAWIDDPEADFATVELAIFDRLLLLFEEHGIEIRIGGVTCTSAPSPAARSRAPSLSPSPDR